MNIICTTCPRGCIIDITAEENGYTVVGNACKRGYDYAVNEITCPKRNFSMALEIEGGDYNVVSVKTSSPVNKSNIIKFAEYLRKLNLYAPIYEGDIVVKGILGTDVDIIAITSVLKA